MKKKLLNNFCEFVHVCLVMDLFCNNEIESTTGKRRHAFPVGYVFISRRFENICSLLLMKGNIPILKYYPRFLLRYSRKCMNYMYL